MSHTHTDTDTDTQTQTQTQTHTDTHAPDENLALYHHSPNRTISQLFTSFPLDLT